MRRIGIALLCAAVCTLVAAAEESKYTNKQIMKLAHGGNQNSLLNRVRSGRASAEDKAKLVELYEAMAENKPKKGDAEGFAKLTQNLVEAAKAAQKGERNAGQLLAKASNCKACHDRYK